ncbi:hypothetical protein C9374_008796 [Naegleria lovaniensis]|uniref:F-box domain-containing protein n=1 Tax=Naegleria lovaniensis TaxID=51637 RepID=A0AA88KH16_NAELO|nr:uncharacterized protein C9374_008796 [Naegleria lovaniensis]KAG2377711.1 hypothetical protein C9374_008796 [Naegleria lovaniensis]
MARRRTTRASSRRRTRISSYSCPPPLNIAFDVWVFGIMQYLDPISVIRLSQVNTLFHKIISKDLDDIEYWAQIQYEWVFKLWIQSCFCCGEHATITLDAATPNENPLTSFMKKKLEKVVQGHELYQQVVQMKQNLVEIETCSYELKKGAGFFKKLTLKLWQDYLLETRNHHVHFTAGEILKTNEQERQETLPASPMLNIYSPLSVDILYDPNMSISVNIVGYFCYGDARHYGYSYYNSHFKSGIVIPALGNSSTLVVPRSNMLNYEIHLDKVFFTEQSLPMKQSGFEKYNFGTQHASQTFAVCMFNRFDKESWNYVKTNLVHFMNSHTTTPVIVVGMNFLWLCSQQSFSKKSNSVPDIPLQTCNDFIPLHSEIMNYCRKYNQIKAFVNLKPAKEDDLSVFMNEILRVCVMHLNSLENKSDSTKN